MTKETGHDTTKSDSRPKWHVPGKLGAVQWAGKIARACTLGETLAAVRAERVPARQCHRALHNVKAYATFKRALELKQLASAQPNLSWAVPCLLLLEGFLCCLSRATCGNLCVAWHGCRCKGEVALRFVLHFHGSLPAIVRLCAAADCVTAPSLPPPKQSHAEVPCSTAP